MHFRVKTMTHVLIFLSLFAGSATAGWRISKDEKTKLLNDIQDVCLLIECLNTDCQDKTELEADILYRAEYVVLVEDFTLGTHPNNCDGVISIKYSTVPKCAEYALSGKQCTGASISGEITVSIGGNDIYSESFHGLIDPPAKIPLGGYSPPYIEAFEKSDAMKIMENIAHEIRSFASK
jgi:hypothetical protein